MFELELTDRKEILYYYESRQNPNGDPGFDNQPRLMSDGRIMVTDVRLKRTIRDYAKQAHNKTLFVDYGEDGSPTTADKRAQELTGGLDEEHLNRLLAKTFDVPLFGALVPIRSKRKKTNEDSTENDEESSGGSFKVSGPVQFGLGRSVNQVEIINPSITGRFVGKEKAGGDQHSTIGKFYSVEYALIKFQGVVNPANLSDYWDDKEIRQNFDENEGLLFSCLWNGTNALITRSKYPQRSVFLLEVTYDNALYNDLPLLVGESKQMQDKVSTLAKDALDVSRLLDALKFRKQKVRKVRVKCCEELKETQTNLVKNLSQMGISVEEIP